MMLPMQPISLTSAGSAVLIPVNVIGRSLCKAAEQSGRQPGLIQRFRDKTNSKNRFFGLVQKLHLPFGVFLEFAGNAADHIAANAGQLFPGGIAVGKFGAVIGSPGVPAISDAKKIERHGMHRCVKAAPGL